MFTDNSSAGTQNGSPCCINIIDVDTDEAGAATRYLIRAVNLTAYDLNKSGIHLTTMEQTAQRIAEQLDLPD